MPAKCPNCGQRLTRQTQTGDPTPAKPWRQRLWDFSYGCLFPLVVMGIAVAMVLNLLR
jgi:hypothetical protein